MVDFKRLVFVMEEIRTNQEEIKAKMDSHQEEMKVHQ
jgi:hypothetical protein